jgi:hypothetical protein
MGELKAFESPGWNVCQVFVWLVFRSAVAVNAAGSAQSPLHSRALKLASVAASHETHGSLAPQVPVFKLR